MKLKFYVSDILPILLHGVEWWNISDKMITQLEKFHRGAIYKMVNRTYRDHIADIEMYEWLHKNEYNIYPIKYVMAERKLRFFTKINSIFAST